jgi:hypothetical protein
MSTEGAVPSAAARRQSLTLVLAIVAVILAGLGGYALGRRAGAGRDVMSAAPPGVQRIAFVTEGRCEDDSATGPCQTLWIGTAREDAEPVATLAGDKERVEAIAWARDGYRVGFLINGYQLRVFNADGPAPVAQVDLVEPSGFPSARIARGITFSQNGAAVTFDDCPRYQSGCRSGLAAIR